MRPTAVFLMLVGLICSSMLMGQKPVEKPAGAPAPPAGDLAKELAQRLSRELQVKTVVGEPIKAGSVTLIPILMVDVNFTGGAMPPPAAGAPQMEGFLMSGEARPIGFIAVTKKGTRFISVANSSSQVRRPE